MQILENEKEKESGKARPLENVQKAVKNGKATWIIVGMGILGIVFIVFPIFSPTEPIPETAQNIQTEEGTADEDYAKSLAQGLEEILGSMAGVGETKVMVTLSQDSEYIYAQDSTLSQQQNGSGEQSLELTSDTEGTHVILDESGSDRALLSTRLRPKVQGVIVVCTGGDDPVVAGQVTEAVSAALGVGSSSIVVTKLK